LNGIIKAGIGWIGSGVVSGGAWLELLRHGVMDYGMLGVCIFVIGVGIAIIAFNKSIDKLRESIIRKREARDQKNKKGI